MIMNRLRDTVALMNSADYKERFQAEYLQTKIRYDKLHKMLVKNEAGTLNFTPTAPIYLLQEQANFMGQYLMRLEIRAEIEGVELENIDLHISEPCKGIAKDGD